MEAHLKVAPDERNAPRQLVETHHEGSIGRLLEQAGKLKPQDLERILELQRKDGLRFGEAAVRLGLASNDDIRAVLALQYEYPYLPESSSNLGSDLVAATAPYGRQAEALRSIRSELLLRWFQGFRKQLAIGSARPGEGASLLAANLAIGFAQLGKKTLLIDSNLREPTQHQIFRLGNTAGLSDLLANRISVAPVNPVAPFETLSVLAAGARPPNPAELLMRPAFGQLLAELDDQYDIILIDVAPARQAADFQSVVVRTGAMLISTRRNVSRIGELGDLKESIVTIGGQVIGAVVMD